MADREKLIECLKYCASTSTTQNDCHGCKRWDFDCGSYHCVDDLMMQAATALEQQKWIPVTERLPEVGSSVIAYNAPAKCAAEAVYKGEGKFLQFRWAARLQDQEVTHWMPLPEPPKEDA